MFICASGEEFSFATPIGVGLIDTAILLSKIIYTKKPNKIVFIGSAGSYDYNLNIHDIFFSHVSTQIESSLFMNASYTPIINEINNVSCETLLPTNIDINLSVVNSSNYITTDKLISEGMLQRGIKLENMEFFSVLKVAEYFNIPAFGIFCITNYCNMNAHKDFLLNHKKAINILIDFILINKYEKKYI